MLRRIKNAVRGYFLNENISVDYAFVWTATAILILLLMFFSLKSQYAGLSKFTSNMLISCLFAFVFEIGASAGMQGVVSSLKKRKDIPKSFPIIVVSLFMFGICIYYSFYFSWVGQSFASIESGGGLKQKVSLNAFTEINDKYDVQLRKIDEAIEKQQDLLNGINGDLTLCEAEQGKYADMKWQRYSKTRSSLRRQSKQATARLNSLQKNRVSEINRIEKNRKSSIDRVNQNDNDVNSFNEEIKNEAK